MADHMLGEQGTNAAKLLREEIISRAQVARRQAYLVQDGRQRSLLGCDLCGVLVWYCGSTVHVAVCAHDDINVRDCRQSFWWNGHCCVLGTRS